MKLMLELVDKVSDGYIIYYSSYNDVRNFIFLPSEIYKKLHNLKGIEYEVKINDIIMRPTVLLEGDKYVFEIGDDILSVPRIKLENKKYKAYCFQAYIDIQVIDRYGQMIGHSYRFLKNYDTKFKARYYTDKFSFKFAKLFKQYFIRDEIVHDLTNQNNELFNNDIIFEHKYVFYNKEFNGTVVYSFNILSIEKG